MPKVSVIVPVYNVEPYIHRCVDSILHQSYQDFELILVDDGSPDNCGAICEEYAAKDSRIHVIHQKNGGLSAARNAGIDWAFSNSDSQWLTFIDSDDWVHREYLKLFVEAAEKNGSAVAACSLFWTECFREDIYPETPVGLVMDAEQAYAEHYDKCVSACNKLIKKYLFAVIRFPVGKLYEDAFVTHEILFEAGNVTIFREPLYYYYCNPDSITRAKWSDKKLESIQAHEIRLAYLEEHGYPKALNTEKEEYVKDLMDKCRHILDTRESESDYRDTLMLIRKKLRTALKDARSHGLVPFNRENLWSYLFAMKTDVVWKAARSLQKIYHKLKGYKNAV